MRAAGLPPGGAAEGTCGEAADGKAVIAGDDYSSSGDVAAAKLRRRHSVDVAGRVRRLVVGGRVGTF